MERRKRNQKNNYTGKCRICGITRFLLLFLLLFFLLSEISSAQEQESTRQVKVLMESCQFSQAIDLADLFLADDSSNASLLLLKGRALAAIYRYKEAATILSKALKTDSANIMVLNDLVDVYRQSGEPAKAIEVSRKITGIAPANSYFSMQLAGLYYSSEEYRQAARVYLQLYTSDSSSFFIARQLGNCYNELKQSDSAIRFYRRALRIMPFDQYVTGKIVNVLIREENVAMALYFTEQYLQQRDPSCIPVLKQNGYCYYLLIDFGMAARQLQRCAGLGDSSKFTMKYLGLAYYKQEKYDSAAPFFRLAFNYDTTDAEVCFYYGVSAYRSLNVDTGMVYLNRTLRLLMPSPQFLSTLYSELADANTSTGQADTAVIYLLKALESNPANNTLRFKIAYQYDYHLRKPYVALPWYREFMRNYIPGSESKPSLPQQVSYSDYARNRILEIAGKKK